MPLADWFDQLGGVTLIEGNLHRSPIPVTDAHFRALTRAGIDIIYSMEEATPGDRAIAHGLDWRPHFWVDDVPPTPRQIERFLQDLAGVSPTKQVLIHCKAGWGRTGTAIACALMVRNGWTAEAALSYYWTRVPRARGVMLANGQAEFVRGFGARLLGRGLA